jgi:ferredoxin, 2Fe-2S
MPQIVIKNLGNKILKTDNFKKSLLNIIHENYIDWMHACGAKGRCTTCKAKVLSGIEHLSALTGFEIKLKNINRLKDDERLACQCYLTGDIIICVPEENKLPHVKYSE